jgi:hypothetical protein
MTGAEREELVANPWHVVDVERLDPATITAVIRQVEVSEGIDQLAYRETEIDSLWSLAHMAVRDGRPGSDEALALLWTAHDSVGTGAKQTAITALTSLRDLKGLETLNDGV